MVTYLRNEIVMLYPFCFAVYDNSASIMSQVEPTLWYVLHTQLVEGVTTWALYSFPGDKYDFVVPSHINGMLVITFYN